MSTVRQLLFLAAALLAIVLTIRVITPAVGQELPHVHPTETLPPKVGEFYRTWMRPDMPNSSCCNEKDCYATEIKHEKGKLYARRREDGKFILVPPTKIETGRDSPDGRNHLCAPPPPSVPFDGMPDTVFCFAFGGGT